MYDLSYVLENYIQTCNILCQGLFFPCRRGGVLFNTILHRGPHKWLQYSCGSFYIVLGSLLEGNIAEGSTHLCDTLTALQSHPLKTLPKAQRPLCSKSEQKIGFITKHQLPSMHQTVANTILIIDISNSNKPQKVLSWHLHTPGSHQSSLLNRC